MKKNIFFPCIILLIGIFVLFKPFFIQGYYPIPADTLIGLYHPFRDLYSSTNPRGIPYKNFLITDPIRQQYPWKYLTIESQKSARLPLWNPYTMAGYPLLGTLQAGTWYPINFLFFLFSFPFAWSLFILLQPVLAGWGMYLYLRNLKLSILPATLGGVSFALCGFSISWLEWGTVGHTALWLPFVLLSIDKILLTETESSKFKIQNSKFQLKSNKYYLWPILFVFSLVSAFFAGHLQTFFYLFIFSFIYLIVRMFQTKKRRTSIKLFILLYTFFLLLTIVQWFPTLQFVMQSARDIDQNPLQQEGWFLPFYHLIQFIIPDFFGNPTTLNYWGTWNYGELVGYMSIPALLFAFHAIFMRRDKKTYFYGVVVFVSLFFATPTLLGKLPYVLHIPFISTAQPTRLLFITDFSLAVLAALGMESYLQRPKKIIFSAGMIALLFILIWMLCLGKIPFISISPEHLSIAKRNTIFPTLIFFLSCLIFSIVIFIKQKRLQSIGVGILICLVLIDLLRFAVKFESFSPQAYLYPPTKSLQYLQNNAGMNRIMSLDSRILPPNTSLMYHLQTIEGYDPLYLLRYGAFIAASERNKPDDSSPFGFHRIITPHNLSSPLIDLLGVKYVLSLDEVSNPHFKKVMNDGETKVYENTNAFPRVFFVDTIQQVTSSKDALSALFNPSNNLREKAIVENMDSKLAQPLATGNIISVDYSAEDIKIAVEMKGVGFLVLTDSYYPTWKAQLLNQITQQHMSVPIYRTDYALRGVLVPKGKYVVEFYNSLF